MGVRYQFDIHSGIRYVHARPAGAALEVEPRETLYGRAWLTAEATVNPPEVGRFRQSYTFEALIPTTEKVLIFYALWTELDSDSLLTESAPFLNGYIEGTEDYLTQLEVECGSD